MRNSVPTRPWIGHMTWRDLLFAHWPVPVSALRPHVPPALEVEEFQGTAWLAVVPFLMTGMRLRWMPPVPGLSRMLELNVRTYVRHGESRGVWFFSLDAEKWLAVIGARTTYHLNYQHARMSLRRKGECIRYESRRTHKGSPPAELRVEYRPVGQPYSSKAGSLENWLTERYALFSADTAGRLYRGDIDHDPWTLQPAHAEWEHNSMTAQIGVALPAVNPLLHFSRRLEVRAWTVQRL